MAGIDERLLADLRCPLSKAPLKLVGDWLFSLDPQTRRKYPIREGIPVLLVDESMVVEQEEFDRVVGARASKFRPNGSD